MGPVTSGVSSLGCVRWGVTFLRAAAGLGSIRRRALTRLVLAPRLLVFQRERLLEFSVDVIQAEGLRPGGLAGGRVAHLFVALLVGVVSRVGGLLTAIAGVRALRVEGPVDDLVGWRSRAEMLLIPQDGFSGFVQAGSTLLLKTHTVN